MPPIVSLCLLAFAVSLDGFGVGSTYGLRKIRIPLISIMIISGFSGIVIYASMHIGLLISRIFSPLWASKIGAFILIGIGIWAIAQSIRNQKKDLWEAGNEPQSAKQQDADLAELPILEIKIKRLGLVVQVINTPSMADVDRSGIISPSEAALLGLALSLDAFGAGIGAALIGFRPIVTATVIALTSGSFFAAGLQVGHLFSDKEWVKKLTVLPGILLILIAILKLM